MDNKKEFQTFVRVLALFAFGLIGVIACVAGCISWAASSKESFYFAPAAINLLGWVYVYYRLIKKWKSEGKIDN